MAEFVSSVLTKLWPMKPSVPLIGSVFWKPPSGTPVSKLRAARTADGLTIPCRVNATDGDTMTSGERITLSGSFPIA